MNTGKATSKTTMISILHFPGQVAGEACAFTTERGTVVDTDPYSEFNCCGYTGDSPKHSLACRSRLARELGIAADSLILPRQVHGTDVRRIDSRFLALSIEARSLLLDGIDALVTAERGIAIGVFTADCVPIVLYAPRSGVAAVAHAGWKGTLHRIAASAVEAMASMGADASDIHAVYGPAICGDCFEVGDEVVEAFSDGGFPLDRIMHRNPATGKAHIHLVEANTLILKKCGVPDENVRDPHLCTRCRPDLYFSARRLGIASGRVVTGILLR